MSNKIRIGVIGAGSWGPNLIRNFHFNSQSTVCAVADPNTARLKLISEKYPDILVTESVDTLLNNPQIDAIVVCTPTFTHYEITKKALLSKKHVFVEKPLATQALQCKELISLSNQVSKTLFVGHIFVYNAGIQAVQNLLKEGSLGKIYHIQITRTNLGPVRTDVSALWDLASHDLAILNYWLDEMPLAVSAVGGRYLSTNLEDTVFATYRLKNNVLANIHVSWLNPKKTREITIVGEKKMLVWDDMNLDKPIHLYDKNVIMQAPNENKTIVDTFLTFRASIHEGDTIIPKIKLNEPLGAECVAFLNAINNPQRSLSNGEHGKWVVQALEATDLSIKENGKEVLIEYN